MTKNIKVSEFVNKKWQMTTCKVGDSIEVAKTKMLLNSFSQLPVLNEEGRVEGCVTWKSIGRIEALTNNKKTVDKYIETPVIVKDSENFFNYVNTIASKEYILVTDSKSSLVGIITTYDMTLYFDDFVSPYLKLGVIEDCIRWLIVNRVGADLKKDISDFVFKEYESIFEKEDNWKKLAFPGLDRSLFVRKLGQIRKIRNKVAHYKPTPLTEEEHFAINSFAEILESMSY